MTQDDKDAAVIEDTISRFIGLATIHSSSVLIRASNGLRGLRGLEPNEAAVVDAAVSLLSGCIAEQSDG